MISQATRFVKNTLSFAGATIVAGINLLFSLPFEALALSVPIAFNLGIISLVRWLMPTALRSAAFTAAPLAATIAPGIIAAACTADSLRSERIYSKETALTSVGGAGLALAAGAQATSALPAVAAAIGGPANLLWLAATSFTAGLGMAVASAVTPETRPAAPCRRCTV